MLSEATSMLTTIDNPYDPFEEFPLWFMYDVEKGYYTCNRLARIANFTDDMTDVEVAIETDRAIDEIIKFDVLNIYKKVKQNIEVKEETEENEEKRCKQVWRIALYILRDITLDDININHIDKHLHNPNKSSWSRICTRATLILTRTVEN